MFQVAGHEARPMFTPEPVVLKTHLSRIFNLLLHWIVQASLILDERYVLQR